MFSLICTGANGWVNNLDAVLPPNLVKSQSREIGRYNDHIALKFDRHLGSAATELLVKFQSDWESLNPISWLRYFTRSCGNRSYRLVKGGPDDIESANLCNLICQRSAWAWWGMWNRYHHLRPCQAEKRGIRDARRLSASQYQITIWSLDLAMDGCLDFPVAWHLAGGSAGLLSSGLLNFANDFSIVTPILTWLRLNEMWKRKIIWLVISELQIR